LRKRKTLAKNQARHWNHIKNVFVSFRYFNKQKSCEEFSKWAKFEKRHLAPHTDKISNYGFFPFIREMGFSSQNPDTLHNCQLCHSDFV